MINWNQRSNHQFCVLPNPNPWIHCLSCLPAEIVNYEFDTKNLVCLVISTFVGVWYLLKKVSLTIIWPSWPLTPAYEAHLPHFIALGMKQLTVSKDSCCCNSVMHSVFWRLGSGLLNSVLSSEGSGELSCCFVTWQHWIANNLFGLAFALNGVELLHLNNVSTGCILLGGLFVYDVFWVSWCAFCNHVFNHLTLDHHVWRHCSVEQ